MKKNKQFYKAVSILIGTIIGAGIFGLPYAIAKVGFIPGVIYIAILALVILLIIFSYGEVVLRTKKHYRMSGYAERYLGKWGKILITISLILGIYGGLLAYTIGIGNFLFEIFNPYFGGTPFIYSLIFWVIGSLAVFRGLGIIASLELFMVGLLIFMVFFVFGFSFAKIEPSNLLYSDFNNLFFPFGVILFALGGATAIPTMKRILEKKNKMKLLKKAIIWGMLIPVLIYLLFCFSVIGVTGLATTEQSIDGLSQILGRNIIYIGGIFGILAMATSFLALAYVLREVYRRDYKIPYFWSSLLTCLVPLIVFILGFRSFVHVLGISGTILGGFQGILLIVMYYKARKLGDRQPEYNLNLPKFAAYFLCLILFFGIVYQIFYLF